MPELSVIVTTIDGLPLLHEGLKALQKQRGECQSEIIVIGHLSAETLAHLNKLFPEVQAINTETRMAIPTMRTLGLSAANGAIVAFTEDRCVASENWLQEILKAHQLGYDAVGGAIENGSQHRLIDWAVYLCEYSSAMLPIPAGETGGIPGNNAAYKKAVLDGLDDNLKKNYWEFFIQQELKHRGIKFLSVPSMIVYKKKQFGFGYFMAQRFHFSRSFAGMRRQQMSTAGRLLYGLLSPALAGLMIWRTAQQVFMKKRFRTRFMLTLPLLSFFALSYAAGEFVGYVFGGGDSLLKVE